MSTLLDAASARQAHVRTLADRPSQRRCAEEAIALGVVRVAFEPQELRQLERDGMTVVAVGGHASVTETPYEMYDLYGPYMEVVTHDAFGKTLAESPLVEFTVNHGAGGGLPMAHTRNDTLELGEDEKGLAYTAYVDPARSDVQDMLLALKRGDLAESSFKFRITKGIWSPDYTEYRIDDADLDRGDVSAVNFGANPAATSGLRATEKPAATRAATSAAARALLLLSAVDDVRRSRI